VDGWFFTRRPGYVLLTIVATQMIATTIVAGTIRAYPFWNPNQGETMIRLTAIDGNYIGACWLFSIIVFLIMECAKFGIYKILYWQDFDRIKATQRTKLKEDMRRRMTSSRATRSGTSSMPSQDLKPTSVAQARAMSSARPRVATADKGLRQPLLAGTDYAS